MRRGWRNFQCFECGHEWKESTRDHHSPSGINCPKCSEFCRPHDSRADESLKVDYLGNLIR